MKKQLEIMTMAGSAVAVLVAVLLGWQAAQLLAERAELVGVAEEQQELVVQAEGFAREHKDYAAYAAKQQQRLQALKRQLVAEQSTNKAVQRLQGLLAAQGLQLVSLELQPALAAKNKGETQLQKISLNAEGDFFSLLRWLRQVERNGFQLTKMELKAAAENSAKLQIAVLIELHSTNL